MADKPNEREIPVFTVLKNNRILKNLYLLDNPPSSNTNPCSSDKGSENEEILLVGRHPDCHIKLEHPSISRFHLRIVSDTVSRSLFVTDLSSVHGTWISGKKLEPDVRTKLNEGDTLQLGGSSRLYRMHWVPYSRAYDTENPFIPQMDTDEEENEQEPIWQDENEFPSQNEHAQSEENLCLSVQKSSPPTPLRSKDAYDSFSNEKASGNLSSPCDIYKNQENEKSSIKSCHFGEEVITPKALSPVSMFQTESQIESLVNLEVESEIKSNLSIWSRRGKPESVKIKTSQSSAKSVRIDSDVKSMVQETYITELNLENRVASPDHVFTPDKEDLCPGIRYNGSLKKKSGGALKSGSILNISVSSLDLNDDEIFTPDKENMTPNTRMLRFMGNLDDAKHEKSYKSPPVKKSINSNLREDGFFVSPLACNENQYGKITFDDDNEEVFTPDKENMTPNTRLLRPMGKLDDVKHEKSYKPSPLKKIVNMHEDGSLVLPSSPKGNRCGNVLQERRSTNSASKSRCGSLKTLTVIKKNAERTPFRPLLIDESDSEANSSLPSIQITTKSELFNYPEYEEVLHVHNVQEKTNKEENRTWIIIVDTGCLLNKKSRKELQLLRGLKGTSLVVPRIVLRELDCMLKRGSLFKRTTEVSEALEWIEDCMKNTEWWIHVQNSAEEGMLIPPTPPASSTNWFKEECAFKISSNPFSPCSLQEIVTPTAEDHILEYTVSLKRARNEQPVILSNDVTLKIKAMAEGVICETVEEFRRSLINPFSDRFLYAGSSPRGPTWSCEDDAVLKEKYYPSPSKKLSKCGGAKGLKLILQHNSSFSNNSWR